jgi:mycofactocin system glycosyltransferase
VTITFPAALAVELDAATREHGDLLIGGAPLRAMRLTASGRAAYDELRAGESRSAAARVLARRLTDGGLAHPRPEPRHDADVSVVIPVRDRPAALGRCLSALGHRHPVVVVDDGSVDADAVAKVVADHGARLIRHDTSRGPGAARNSALEEIDTEFVAFLDSDCVAPAGSVEALAGHFDDPLVAAVAPRIVPAAVATPAQRYAVGAGALDLGPRPARVVPLSPVAYVPTAALLVRRAALAEVAFDESMRYGEDVDLVWRLHAAGWRIRYDPSVEVHHDEPASWRVLLVRRYRYGTSAAPLAIRHPRNITPAVFVVARVGRRPHRALAVNALSAGRYLSTIATPIAVLGLASRRSRLGAAALLVAPAVQRWARRRPPLDLPRFVAASIADDAAYGAGVWAGAIRHRTSVPLRPALHRVKERPDG